MAISDNSILIVQTAFLGDVLLSIPLLKEVRKKFPRDKLIYICRKGLGRFLIDLGLVDQVFEIEKGRRSSYQKIIKELRKERIDLILCPHESIRTSLFILQLKAKKKIGFHMWWNFFAYNQRVKKNSDLPEALRQLSVLEPLSEDLSSKLERYFSEVGRLDHLPESGMKSSKAAIPDWASMSLVGEVSSLSSQRAHLIENLGLQSYSRPWVFLFPGSVWMTKQWTTEGFIEVGQQLSKDFQVVIHGAANEVELCTRVAEKISGSLNLAGKTNITETFLLLTKASIVISNDSGSMHLAACADIPTVAIFGPTVLKFGYRPWQNHAVVVEENSLLCRPCAKHGGRKCPIKTHACMKMVSSDTVVSAALAINKETR